MQLLTQKQYAEHRGVSKQAIGKLVARGKIPVVIDPRTGQKRIDPAQADLALGASIERVDVERQRETEEGAGSFSSGDGAGLTKAKTATEVYRARLAQLEYDQKIGRVLRVEDVTRSMERCAEAVIRDIDQMPTRADDLAVAFTNGGVDGLRKALKQAARDIRRTLSENMRLLSEGDEEPAQESGDLA